MTTSGKSNTGRDSGAGGVCQPPQQAQRWIQGLTIPAECFEVRLTVHRTTRPIVYGYHIDVRDPHTSELLAAVAHPVNEALTSAGLVGNVVVDLRSVLLELTDPEPF